MKYEPTLRINVDPINYQKLETEELIKTLEFIVKAQEEIIERLSALIAECTTTRQSNCTQTSQVIDLSNGESMVDQSYPFEDLVDYVCFRHHHARTTDPQVMIFMKTVNGILEYATTAETAVAEELAPPEPTTVFAELLNN